MSADLFEAFVSEGENQKQARELAALPTSTPTRHPFDFQPPTLARSIPQQVQQSKDPSPLWERNDGGGDILFDADEAAFDDDFGDFATASKPSGDGSNIHKSEDTARSADINVKERQENRSILGSHLVAKDETLQRGQPANMGLRAHNLRTATWTQEDGPETAGDDDWGDFEQSGAPEPPSLDSLSLGQSSHPLLKVEETIADVPDDDWEPFDGDASASAVQLPAAMMVTGSTERATPPATVRQASALPVFERPTNVPPPSSLLQLLSIVFQSLHRSNAEAGPPKKDLASQVLITFRTASRIVAGRTLRWKRDTILAQSVRLGQAGMSGGMKLAAVNRSETTKEESDTEDLIQDWSNYVHEFNSIVARSGSPPQRMKLSSKTSLKLSKGINISNSLKQCALCGLRRTERLSDVDADIDDLFGEFWVEHWGHKDCYDFWYAYKTFLGQR